MKKVEPSPEWKDSWTNSYIYDRLEIYGEVDPDRGHAYSYEQRKNEAIELIKQVVKRGDRILDVAGGQGNFSLQLAELGYDVTWNDIREELVEYIEMKREFGSITYKPGNVFEAQFDHLFDAIIATEIIEHVAHPDDFLFKLSKLIKPGGHIVITTPLGSYFKNDLPRFSEFANPEIFEKKQFMPNSDGHIFLLHLDEVEGLAKKAGLSVITTRYYTNSLTHGHVKLSYLLKVLSKKTVLKIDKFTQKLPFFIGKHIHDHFSVLLKKD